jgi:hypothetical protein
MHIHSYQIHNVLNVYRKQLSRATARNASGNPDKSRPAQDRIDNAVHGQRQSLFDKISSEIVQRITQYDPDTETVGPHSSQSAQYRGTVDGAGDQGPAFTYTTIDKYNQKSTHNLSIRQLNFPTKNMDSLNRAQSERGSNTASE